MKFMTRFFKVTVLFLFLIVFNSTLYSQPTKDAGNVYTTWMKLALVGKNQAEIEFFFRNLDDKTINKIKKRIRFAIIDNLKRSGIKSMIAKSSDADDINVVIRKVITEIRYSGLEHDPDLRLSIKEEFGITLEKL